ncbi:MAG: TolC family protein [Planctomycetales bacterium]|nr:TolC family protein [Planctomycetales bacterium]
MKLSNRKLRATRQAIAILLVATTVGTGCRSSCKDIKFNRPTDFSPIGNQIEYTDTCVDQCSATETELDPHTLSKAKIEDFKYRDISLDEAVQTALANSTVMRDLGARVLLAPQGAATIYDPAITQMNPGVGEEAALSAFDAQWATGIIFNRSERAFNNRFFGGGATSVGTNSAAFQTGVSKTAATGTQFALTNSVDYSRVNRDIQGNLDNSVYDVVYQAEVRHPLLKGGGITFNRIAGPNAGPGAYRGILIARINTDIALADFEASVRDFVRDIYNTYWQLYFAYQDLDARKAGLAAAQESWRTAKIKFESGAADAVDQAVAEQQYYDFERQVQNALSGQDGGSGILTAERNLRLLMGIQMNDGLLLRPSDEPTRAETVFDWYESLAQGVTRRVEIRRQQWNVKASEYQLLASRNQLLPQLDLIGQYNWRGFNSNLLGSQSAYKNLMGGDLQGWQLGLQMSTPIGNRIGHVAVKQAELQLARNRALLREQHKYLVKDLSDSFGELSRAYEITQTLANGLIAAQEQVRLRQERYEAGTEILQFLVQAQSGVANTRSALVQSLVAYNLAIADIHLTRGTFLDFMGVELAEGGWTQSSFSAARKEARRFQQSEMDCYIVPCPISRGRFQQHVLPRGEQNPAPVVPGEPTPADAAPLPAEAPVPTDIDHAADLGA